jgi:transcriptional regulator with XRE-family HTH domain
MTTTLGKIPGPVIVEQPDPETFHGRLELVRRDCDISGNEMARRLGVPVPTVATWLKGTVPTNPSQIEVCDRVAETFEIDFVWLAGGPKWAARYKGATARYPRSLAA